MTELMLLCIGAQAVYWILLRETDDLDEATWRACLCLDTK